MRKARSFMIGTLALVSALAIAGQMQPNPTPGSTPPAGQQPETENFVLRSQVPMVVLDVVVTDKHGHPVLGLKQANFSVFENRKPMTVLSFEEHRVEETPPSAPVLVKRNLPPNVFTNTEEKAAQGPLNILLLDALNTPIAYQPYVHKQMISFVKNLPEGTNTAIFGLSTHLYILQGFTTDHSVLTAALESKKGLPFQAWMLLSVVDEQIVANSQQFIRESAPAALRLRLEYTCDALNDLARYLSALPGRKNLIWLIPGPPFPPLLDEDVPKYLKVLFQRLTAAHVAVYPVDARGLFNDPRVSAAYTPIVPTVPNHTNAYDELNPNYLWAQNRLFFLRTAGEHYTMNKMADETGGKAFQDTNDLKGAVQQAINHGSNYYTLSYETPNRKFDDSLRWIHVKLDQPDVNLSYRQGYYATNTNARPPEQTNVKPKERGPSGPAPAAPPPPSAMTRAMLRGGPEPTQILMAVRIVPAADWEDALPKSNHADEKKMKPPYRHYTVYFAPEVRNLAFSATPSGAYTGSLDFETVLYDPNGEVMNSTTSAVNLKFSAEKYKAMKQNGLQVIQQIDAPAQGEYFLRLGVNDKSTDGVGAIEVPLAAIQPEPAAPPPALTSTTPGRIDGSKPDLRELPSELPRTETWRMAGRVASPDNEPVAGVSVQFQLASGANLAPAVETNPEGLFEALVPVMVGDTVNGKPVGSPVELRVTASKSGYKEAHEDIETSPDNSQQLALVLQDNGRRATLLTPEELIDAQSRQLLSMGTRAPAANDIYRQGMDELLRKHQTLAAIPILRHALALDPNCWGCKFLLGLAHFEAGGWAVARAYLTEAAGMNAPEGSKPKLSGPLVSLAVLDMWQGDWESAARLLKTALEAAPDDGLALQEEGRLAMFHQDFSGAEETLRQAVREGALPEAHLLRARLDLDQDDVQGAKDEFQQYISKLPLPAGLRQRGIHTPEQWAEISPAALDIRDDLQDRTQLNSYRKTKTMVTRPLAELVSQIPELQGIEPAPSQEPLPSLLKNVGASVEKFMSEVPNTISDESIHQERLGDNGRVVAAREQMFDYLVLVHAGRLPSTGEYRTDASGKEVGENYRGGFMATQDFAVLLTIFHPAFQPGTDFRLLGRQSKAGHDTQVVAFAQRPKDSRFVLHFTVRRGRFPFMNQGMAWVDIHTYQIVWLRTDLLRPLDQVGLKQITASTQLAQTKVEGAPATFWLPQKVNVVVRYNNQIYRNEHMYTNFRLFGAETRIGPAEPTSE